MMPGLPLSWTPQLKQNCHRGPCLESFQVIGLIEPTSITAHEASKTICKGRPFNSWRKLLSFLEETINSSKEVFTNFHSDMAVRNRKLANPIRKTAENNVTV
jgi:hypothetical protein